MEQAPPTLLDVLSVNLILRQTSPYVSLASLLSLSATNKSLRALIHTSPEAWRRLDLSNVKSATIDSSPIDAGGISWRAERMDEALTEDDFYSGPLRGIFSRLHAKGVLRHVRTLILDGLSVPADLVREIIGEDRFNVRILSLRECKHLNTTKLQQVLRYAVRPGRPDGSPKLRGLYIFGRKDSLRASPDQIPARHAAQPPTGVTASEGAQIGAEWNSRSSITLSDSLPENDQERWYGRSGRAIARPTSEWADTLYDCSGIIAFDAMLCRGPRHDITLTSGSKFLTPALASVALGPQGCESCASCPEGPAVFGKSSEGELPLLAPPPSHGSTVRAAQRPELDSTDTPFPLLIARCEECLRDRWCERCNRWWCEDCYQEPVARTGDPPIAQTATSTSTSGTTTSRPHVQSVEWAGPPPAGSATGQGPAIKIGVRRDCIGCGRTCAQCKARYMRRCRYCRAEYCIIDNEGSSDTECDWCNQSGRRTREQF